MKALFKILPLICSAALLGGCAAANVKVKSSPAGSAQLRSSDEKTYVLYLNETIPAPAALHAQSLARAELEKAGYRAVPPSQARYRIKLSAATMPKPASAAELVRHSPRTSTTSTASYIQRTPSGETYGVVRQDGSYGMRKPPSETYNMVHNGSNVTVSYDPAYSSSWSPSTYSHPVAQYTLDQSLGSWTPPTIYTHSLKLEIEDRLAERSSPIWEASAVIHCAWSKPYGFLDVLIADTVKTVGKPSHQTSPVKLWLTNLAL